MIDFGKLVLVMIFYSFNFPEHQTNYKDGKNKILFHNSCHTLYVHVEYYDMKINFLKFSHASKQDIT